MTKPLFEQTLENIMPSQLDQLDKAPASNVISFVDAARQRLSHFSDHLKTSIEHMRELGGMAQKNLGQVTKTAQTDLARRVQATSQSVRPVAPVQVAHDGIDYLVDTMQRWVLFIDLLRQRGNQFVEHEKAGCPPVLVFDYDMILDGRALPRPVNYALVEIVPPADWNITIDRDARPYVIIDPRAGHGAGIGGFKSDSQVGVALRAGHAVYFVIFFPDPEPGQTILDVCEAEAEFIKKIRTRHPNSDKPVIIGNCQGGWAVMMLGASNPDITGPIVINGAPLSYWAGENGRNPMRYIGGLAGGAWPAILLADMGNGRFDGANLVQNFENLNPVNTYWSKLYDVYSHVDTEGKRFLEFERWWGGFYFMTDEEIEWIVGNLFIGNKFAGGKIEFDGHTYFDMRAIKSPIVVFASSGDNSPRRSKR
jgi:pimeloyl-ACP methyl ester carboxylesterase